MRLTAKQIAEALDGTFKVPETHTIVRFLVHMGLAEAVAKAPSSGKRPSTVYEINDKIAEVLLRKP